MQVHNNKRETNCVVGRGLHRHPQFLASNIQASLNKSIPPKTTEIYAEHVYKFKMTNDRQTLWWMDRDSHLKYWSLMYKLALTKFFFRKTKRTLSPNDK